jgi:tRNA 2-thiouridine synthesizing protein E
MQDAAMNTPPSPPPPVFDADGFLTDPEMWSESLAGRIAQADGLGELNELQLSVLHALRHEFAKHGTVTALSHVCHLTGQSADCMQHLFPTPREAWRVAGLPNPGEEAKSYL